MRFARDEIYTYVGSLLLAVNPYKVRVRLRLRLGLRVRFRLGLRVRVRLGLRLRLRLRVVHLAHDDV